MTESKLGTVEDICRWPIPDSPDQARRHFHIILHRLAIVPDKPWTRGALATLKDYLLDLQDAYPDETPGWLRDWQEAHPEDKS